VIADHSFFSSSFFREKIMRWKVSTLGSVLCVLGLSSAAGAATIAQWNFDSLTNPTGSTSLTPDASGNGHDITFAEGAWAGGSLKGTALSSSTPYTPAVTGDSSVALYNTGNQTATNIASPGTINLTTNNAFTIQGWMNPSVISSNNYYLSLTNGLPNTSGGIGIYLGTQTHTGTAPQPASVFTANLSYGNAGHLVQNTTTMSTSSWNFVAITFDGSTLNMYVQDANHPTLTNVATLGSLSVTLPTFSVAELGTSNTSGNVLYDDFRISDTALSQADLAASMVSFTPVTVPEPASLSLLGLGGLLLIRRRGRISA
jgi:hypothetical protein